MKTTSIALFIILLLVGFEWIKTDYELREVRRERDAMILIAQVADSVNTVNIENQRILMNRLDYYTKKSHKQKSNEN